MYVCVAKKQELAELIGFVTTHYSTHWRRIGILLNISDSTLDDIEQEYLINPHWCCDKMLNIWKETDESASWNMLVTTINSLQNTAMPKVEGNVTIIYRYRRKN